MVKITLVRPSYSNLYTVYQNGKIPKNRDIIPPLGLMYLSAVIKKQGFDVEIIDGEVTLESPEEIAYRAKNSDFVAVSTSTPNYDAGLRLVKSVKKLNKKIVTILGGAHPTALPNEVAKEKYIDFIVVGEGEASMMKIIRGKAEGKIINSEQVDLDSLPMADHDIIDYNDYLFSEPNRGFVKMASVITSRGCPFQCSFCFHQFKGVRFRNPEKVVDEIEYLYKKGIEFFYLYDDTFTVNKERAIKICRDIRKRKITACFHCATRANCIDEELVKEMKKAGFVKTTLGIESGNEKMLKAINKCVTKNDIRKAFKILNKHGIETRGSFILGLPYETRKTAEDTIRFALELDLFRASFNIMTPYPKTKIYEMALRNEGISFVNKDWKSFRRWGNAVIKTDELSADELVELQKDALMRFYTSKKRLLYHLKGLLKGNFSLYYYRPVVFAIRRKIKKMVSREKSSLS